MAKKTNDENFQKYQERLAELQKEGNLVPSPDLPPEKLIPILLAEGEKLLAADEQVAKLKTDSKKMLTPPPVSSSNPYLRARVQILNSYPVWRKKELAEMEKTGKVNNRFYDDFVHEVRVLGDSLANQ